MKVLRGPKSDDKVQKWLKTKMTWKTSDKITKMDVQILVVEIQVGRGKIAVREENMEDIPLRFL